MIEKEPNPLNESEPRFAFYEEVCISSRAGGKTQVDGQTGAVLGRVRTGDGSWYYAVYVYSTEMTWCFFEHELLPTGRQKSRDDFFGGSSIRVKVDDKGRGGIAPDA